jgi:hypothetical protein
LDRPTGGAGALAHDLFEKLIRSQRVAKELGTGRAWVDRALAQVQLGTLNQTAPGPAFIPRLADVQALLLAKLSVDPKTYDTYFHLGGTSLLLTQYALRNQLPELAVSARPMVQSALRYAQDLKPADPKTQQLQNMWIDAKKL